MNRFARSRRAVVRGVTLVEVMIVVVILGLIAGGVAVAVFPKLKEGQIKTTTTNLIELRRAAEHWRADHADSCPTPQQLVADKAIDATARLVDAWETPYKILCEGDETFTLSFGPDKREGTPDDIRIPLVQVPGGGK